MIRQSKIVKKQPQSTINPYCKRLIRHKVKTKLIYIIEERKQFVEIIQNATIADKNTHMSDAII